MTEPTSYPRLEALVDGVQDVLLELDLEGRVHYANPAVEALLGYPRGEIMDGQAHWDIFHPDDLPTVLELAVRVFEGDAFTHLVCRVRHADGEYRTFESSAKRYDLAPGEGRLAVVMRDITTRSETEAVRQQLPVAIARAQHADSLQILAGGVAHDFGNLLQGVLANAEIARMDLARPDAVEARLGDVVHAAERAAELCRQMLAYTGQGQRRVEPIDLNAITREIIPLLRASVSKKVVIEPRVPEDGAWLMGDATQLRQLLMNLVINAGQAIGDRTGHVVVETRAVVDADPPSLEIVVRDDGAGMDAETRERVFDPFFTTKPEGRGLGLAAVADVVTAHLGSIEVDSQPGEGTTFTVHLPVAGASARRPLARSAASGEVRGGRALFVDDEPSVRSVGNDILRDVGFEVTLACDGEQAVDRVKNKPDGYDVVILDMTMPVMDGREALQAIRKLAPELPVLLCSGYTHHALGPLVDDDPRTGFLPKPYLPQDLIRAIGPLIGR